MLNRVGARVRISIGWVTMVCHLVAVPIWAKDVVLADWAVPFQVKLPPVSKAIISEVDDLWATLSDDRHSGIESGFPPDDEYFKAARRLVELRDQGDQALLWQYVKAPEPGIAYGPHMRRRNQILWALEENPGMVQWVLPIARARASWLANKMASSRDILNPDALELSQILSYYYAQGELDDIKTVDAFWLSAVNAGFAGEVYRPQTLEQQLPQIERVKARAKRNSHAHWQWLAMRLIGKGQLDRSVLANDPNYAKQLERMDAYKKSAQTILPHQNTAAALKPDAATTGESYSRSPLAWLLVVLAATVGAVWVFLRKTK